MTLYMEVEGVYTSLSRLSSDPSLLTMDTKEGSGSGGQDLPLGLEVEQPGRGRVGETEGFRRGRLAPTLGVKLTFAPRVSNMWATFRFW